MPSDACCDCCFTGVLTKLSSGTPSSSVPDPAPSESATNGSSAESSSLFSRTVGSGGGEKKALRGVS